MLFSFVDWLYSCVQYVQEVTLLYAIAAKRPTNLLPRRFLLGASDSFRPSSLPITNHRELPPFITMHAHRFPARINEIIGMPKSHRKVLKSHVRLIEDVRRRTRNPTGRIEAGTKHSPSEHNIFGTIVPSYPPSRQAAFATCKKNPTCWESSVTSLSFSAPKRIPVVSCSIHLRA